MPVCATLVNSWGSPPTLQFQSITTPTGGFEACDWLYMTGSDYTSFQGVFGNVDASLIAFGSIGAVAMWAAGFGVGLVISTVRKFRTP